MNRQPIQNTIHILVDYLFPNNLGPGKELLEVELPHGSTVGDLLSYLLESYGETARQQLVKKSDGTPFVTFLVNGEQVDLQYYLSSEDKVLIVPPIAGG